MKTQLEPPAFKVLQEIQSPEIAPTAHRNLADDKGGISNYRGRDELPKEWWWDNRKKIS